MDNFDRFWAAYPRKVKKKDTRKVWERLGFNAWTNDAFLDYMLEDIGKRLANDDRWKRGFIPDPTTYLRGERWNDEIVKAPTPPTGPKPAAHMLYQEPEWMKKP